MDTQARSSENNQNFLLPDPESQNSRTSNIFLRAQDKLAEDDFEIDEEQLERIRTQSTIIKDFDYFRQDLSRSNSSASYLLESQTHLMTKYAGIDEVFVDFNFRAFFSTFTYHLLYFSLLGPLVLPIVCIVDGFNLARNMEFITFTRMGFTQFFIYLCHLVAFITFFFVQKSEVSMAAGFGLFSSLVFRCAVIALKYAFINKGKFEILRRHYVPAQLRAKDQIFPNWANQNYQSVFKELRESMKRHEIDDALFAFHFQASKNDCQCEQEVMEKDKLIKQSLADKDFFNCQLEHSSEKIHGLSLLYFWIDKYNPMLKKQQRLFMIVSVIISLVFIVAPYVLQIDEKFRFSFHLNFPELASYEGLGFCVSFLPGLFFSTLDFFFLFFVLLDSKRIFYLMKNLTAAISKKEATTKEMCKNAHLVNHFDVLSLKTWSYMRRVVVDYGKYYRSRVEFASAIYMIYSTVLVGYLLIFYLVGEEAPYKLLNFLILAKLAVLVVIILICFICSAHINLSFLSQKAACQEIRNVLLHLSKFKYYYFEGETKTDDYTLGAKQVLEEYEKHKKLKPELKLEEHINDLTDTLKDVMYEIEFDLQYNNFKVLGVKAEVNLFKQVILGIVSFVLSTIVKYLINNRSTSS